MILLLFFNKIKQNQTSFTMDNQMTDAELKERYERVCNQKQNYKDAKSRYFIAQNRMRNLNLQFNQNINNENLVPKKLF